MEYKMSLLAARVNAGKSRKDAAEELGVSYATLANWEKGVTIPKLNQARNLAELYGVVVDDIFLSSKPQ